MVTVSFGITLAFDGIATMVPPTPSFQPVMSTAAPLVFWIVSVGSVWLSCAPMILIGAAAVAVPAMLAPAAAGVLIALELIGVETPPGPHAATTLRAAPSAA